jgi:hypothetical protein
MLPETDNLMREDGSGGSGNENTAGGGPDDEDGGWDGSGGSGDSDGTTNGNLLIQTSGGCRSGALAASRPFIAENSLEISIIDGFARDRHAENLFYLAIADKKVC